PIVEGARRFAEEAHGRIGHQRKFSGAPYTEHLQAVARLVGDVSKDPETLAAAWLHDTVEDTPVTIKDIEVAFGPTLAKLVLELTDVSRPGDGNRAVRKTIDLNHLALASPRAKTVKLADLIDNCQDICKHDPAFAGVYIAEMNALLGVLKEGDKGLYSKASNTMAQCASTLGLPLGPEGYPGWLSDAPPRHLDPRVLSALRVFTRSFSAHDIAEPLLSFDGVIEASGAKDAIHQAGQQVVGIRQNGLIIGYASISDLGEKSLAVYLRPFFPGQVLDSRSSLSDVISILTRHDFCFLTIWGQIAGVVSRGDIQKPVVRMWLFGMITLIEMKITDRVESLWPENSWKEHVSEGRLGKAEELRRERQRRSENCRLLDCLQFSDKFQLLLEDEQVFNELGFVSKAQGKKAVKRLESLRNHLAHSQDIVSHDWPLIVRIAQGLENLVESALPHHITRV
ncbi:MAG TPA: HD domain-containing protein, partial [Thermodesulfobacteriota bacterium]|nr:HD domain-containing protein [Thermodesulfobacteriota bacterium]